MALLHVLASGWDQFVNNVIKFEGEIHQVPIPIYIYHRALKSSKKVQFWEFVLFASKAEINIF